MKFWEGKFVLTRKFGTFFGNKNGKENFEGKNYIENFKKEKLQWEI
jgi:hypothetical protein